MLSLHASLRKHDNRRQTREVNNNISSSNVQQVVLASSESAPGGVDVRNNGNNSMRLIPIEGVNGSLIASLLSGINADGEVRASEANTTGRLFILHV